MIKFKDYYLQTEVVTAFIAAVLVGYETNVVWGVAAFFAGLTTAPRLTT